MAYRKIKLPSGYPKSHVDTEKLAREALAPSIAKLAVNSTKTPNLSPAEPQDQVFEKMSASELFPLPDRAVAPHPMESLAAASAETLQEIMLQRMSTVANLKRDIGLLITEMTEQMADAKVAELLLHRKAPNNRNGGSR